VTGRGLRDARTGVGTLSWRVPVEGSSAMNVRIVDGQLCFREPKELARRLVVLLTADVVEPGLLQDAVARGVPDGDVGPQRHAVCVGPVPGHQAHGDLGSHALPPQLPPNGVAEFAPVPMGAKAGSTDELIVVIDEAPFRDAELGVLGDVLVDECRGLKSGFGTAFADEPHGLLVGVDLRKPIYVGRQP